VQAYHAGGARHVLNTLVHIGIGYSGPASTGSLTWWCRMPPL